MARTSRRPGFYKVTVGERRALVGDATGADPSDIERALEAGGLDAETADKFVENVLGTYGLPFGVALNVRVNGHDHVVPMVIEEPSVVAAASNAAKIARAGGGFVAEADPPHMIAQVQLHEVPDAARAVERIAGARRRDPRGSPIARSPASSRAAAERARSRRASSPRTWSSPTSSSTARTRWERTS